MCTALRKTIRHRGYRQINEVMGQAIDFTLALFFLFPAMLIMAVCCVLYKIFNWNRGPVFYRGERLGKNRRVFYMYKIRTLAVGAETQFSADVLTPGSGVELRFGKFFRRTRLDELPQLVNILRGDMSFVGPRPLRPALYEKFKNSIPNYDDRFMVRPGLIGYSQLCTPHSTPKRIRALIDNRYVRIRRNALWDLVLIGLTGFFLGKNFLEELALTVRDYAVVMLRGRKGRDQRKMRRMGPTGIKVSIVEEKEGAGAGVAVYLEDINYEALRMRSSLELALDERVHLRLDIMEPRRKRTKVAKAEGVVYRRTESPDSGKEWVYVLFYEPSSALNRYVIDQYILKQSIFNIF